MLPYIIIILLLLYFVFKYDFKGKITRKYEKAEKALLIILILFAGLRNRVGGDTMNYESLFHSVPPINEAISGWQSTSEKNMLQPLWYFANSLFRTFTDNFVWFQLFISILFNTLIFRFIDKTTNFRFTAILLFFLISWWDMAFEVMRESICVALFANSLLDLNKGKIKCFFLWNLPSVFIHWFSLPMILASLTIYYLNIGIAVPLLLAIGLYCLLFVNPNTVSSLAMVYGSLLGESSSSFIENYLSNDSIYGFSHFSLIGTISALFTSFLPGVVFFSKKVRDFKMEKIIILFVSMSLVTSGIPIFNRFLNYLYVVIITFTVDNIYIKDKSNPIIFSRLLCAIFLILLCMHSVKSFYLPYPSMSEMSYNPAHIPYTSIFQDPDPVRELYFSK